MLLLDHVGAKSGDAAHERRSSTARTAQNLVLVASKGGYPKNPAWFHNLLANPDTTVADAARARRTCTRASPAPRSARGCGS